MGKTEKTEKQCTLNLRRLERGKHINENRIRKRRQQVKKKQIRRSREISKKGRYCNRNVPRKTCCSNLGDIFSNTGKYIRNTLYSFPEEDRKFSFGFKKSRKKSRKRRSRKQSRKKSRKRRSMKKSKKRRSRKQSRKKSKKHRSRKKSRKLRSVKKYKR